MILTHSPAKVIAQLLRDKNIGSDPKDEDTWPVFTSMQDLPNAQIVVSDVATPTKGRITTTGESLVNPGVMFRVRSATAEEAEEKMHEIAALCEELKSRDSDGNITKVVKADKRYHVKGIHMQHSPIDTGQDDNKRHVYSLNCITTICEF